MAYTIDKSDGTVLAVITSDSEILPGQPLSGGSTPAVDLTLYGQGRTEWGERANENFIHLLENFNASTAPSNPLQGQTWHDKTNLKLNYWDGSVWQELVTIDPTSGSPLILHLGDTTINGTLDLDGDLNMNNGDVIFPIPSAGDSKGVVWSGQTDQMRLYVEETSSSASEWVLEVSDNYGDSSVNGDGLSIRFKKFGESYSKTIARFFQPSTTTAGVLAFPTAGSGTNDGSVAPSTPRDITASSTSLVFNEGGGSINTGPDIHTPSGAMSVAAGNGIVLIVDTNNSGSTTQSVQFRTGNKQANLASTYFLASPSAFTYNGNTIWHAGNDGPSSGLYAQYAATATNATNAANATEWDGAPKTVSSSAPSGGSNGDIWFQL